MTTTTVPNRVQVLKTKFQWTENFCDRKSFRSTYGSSFLTFCQKGDCIQSDTLFFLDHSPNLIIIIILIVCDKNTT